MKGGVSFLNASPIPQLLPLPNDRLSIARVYTPKRRRLRAEIELRVCVNRTCRRQGSLQTLETLSGIASPDVAVKSCGCLGRCGAGPNLVALPDGVIVGHCGTAARAAEVMMSFVAGDAQGSLAALALRKRAENELEKNNFSEAELLLSQAIDLKPSGGIHIIYKVRSSARLTMSNYAGALEDANEALTLAPRYPEAYICQGDAFLAMDQFDDAEKSYSTCLELDPSIRRSKSFRGLGRVIAKQRPKDLGGFFAVTDEILSGANVTHLQMTLASSRLGLQSFKRNSVLQVHVKIFNLTEVKRE